MRVVEDMLIEVKLSFEELVEKLDLEPIRDRIFLAEDKIEQIGTIIIPDSAQGGMNTSFDMIEGTVIKAGPDCVIAKVGDRALYGKYAGAQTIRNEQMFTVIDEGDLIAKITKKEEK